MQVRAGYRTGAAVVLLLSAAGLSFPAAAARRPAPPPPAQGSFSDQLQAYDTTRWIKADGWVNGSPFANGWSADHVLFQGGFMDLRLDNVPMLGEPYTSGEYRTIGFHGYGCYEASFRPVATPGAVTSFFTFAGPKDNGGNGKHNEIDIEFLGRDTSSVQVNFYTNDDTYTSQNEALINLGFDASRSSHAYGFKWTSTGISWYLDGGLVYSVTDSALRPTPKASESLQKIMLNLWPVDATLASWAGTFVYPDHPLDALYDWVRYTAGESCTVTGLAPAAPPPGDPSIVHVQSIAVSLDPTGNQVITRVSVVDGLGQPVLGATVSGTWSGVITGGDTTRTTDTSGLATFYSSRSRTRGTVTFCVTNVTRGSLNYDQTLNLETCDSITK